MISWKKYFTYQADYQHWANEVLFKSLDMLTEDARRSDQGLFFKDIHYTADHMLVVLINWMARLKGETPPHGYNKVVFDDWRELKQAMRREVRAFQRFLDDQPDHWFEGSISYTSGGQPRTLWVTDALTHINTHFVHHRGQLSAIATRLGAPVPEMDFVYYKREMQDHLTRIREDDKQ